MNPIRRDAGLLLSEWLNDEARLSRGLGYSDEESVLPDLDENSPGAWPYYAAMLDIAPSRAIAEWLGWQRIMYYLRDARKDWPQQGREIVHDVAASAATSPQVGQFICQRLLLDLADISPGVAALAVEVLDRHYRWEMADNLVYVRDSVLRSPDPVLQHEPHCDFASPGLRATIVSPFDTLLHLPGPGFPDMTAFTYWSTAVSASVAAKPVAPSLEVVVRALAPARDAELDPPVRDQIISDVLEAGVESLSHDRRFTTALAGAVESFDLADGLVTGFALAELLRQTARGERRPDGAGRPVWRAFHPRD